MARRSPKRTTKTDKKRAHRFRLTRLLPSARTRRRLAKLVRRTPPTVRVLLTAVAIVSVWLVVNWSYQVARKPSELFFPVSESLYKQPADTWRAYGYLFEEHSTSVMTPDLLAALAQVEGSGNPIARTYWQWSPSFDPFEIFRPASSAVGMYQFTDGTFAAARHYCIHNHRVAEQGQWYSVRSCWFNGLYTRTIPSHAIELTSAYLDHSVALTLERYPAPNATLQQKQRLAAMLHLCGAGAATDYARRGLQFAPGQHCGAHDARVYVERVMSVQRRFAALAGST
jgi:hypothetical protein